MGVSLYPAISQSPRGQLYGWLPLSNAYGISSIENIARSFCQPMKTNILFSFNIGGFFVYLSSYSEKGCRKALYGSLNTSNERKERTNLTRASE